jgi:hypothetical protein
VSHAAVVAARADFAVLEMIEAGEVGDATMQAQVKELRRMARASRAPSLGELLKGLRGALAARRHLMIDQGSSESPSSYPPPSLDDFMSIGRRPSSPRASSPVRGRRRR